MRCPRCNREINARDSFCACGGTAPGGIVVLNTAAPSWFGTDNGKHSPRALVEQFLKNSDPAELKKYAISFTTEHQLPKISNTDPVTVTITGDGQYGSFSTACKALYEYDSDAGTWSLSSAGEWSARKYSFGGAIVGKVWQVPAGVGSVYGGVSRPYTVQITSLDGDRATVNFSMQEEVYGGERIGNVVCNVSCSQTVILDGLFFKLSVGLPRCFYEEHAYGKRSKTAEVYVSLSLTEGILSVQTHKIVYVKCSECQ